MEALGLHKEISTFGFVFGTFPTAPSVFVFATLFQCAASLVSLTNANNNEPLLGISVYISS